MSYDPERHQRRSIRLAGYDYTQQGVYFVTICVYHRLPLLADIVDGAVQLRPAGVLAEQCWLDIPNHFSSVSLGAYVLMPNHLHGLIVLGVGSAPLADELPQHHLGAAIGAFKTTSARQINTLLGKSGSFWQRGYYEHIVRTGRSLARLETYIAENPLRWAEDQLRGTW